MNLKTKLSVLLLTPILCLVAASPAAASYTLGQLHAPYVSGQCIPTIAMQTGVAPGTAAYWMPAGIGDGVITGWQTATGPNAGSAKLEVLRPTGVAGEFRVLATDGSFPVYANTFPKFTGLRIPVQEGDAIALLSSGTNCTAYFPAFPGGAYSYAGFGSGVDPGPGGTVTEQASATNFALELMATVEIDRDGDGYGDDSQDQCWENAAAQVPPCSVAPPAGGAPSGTGTPTGTAAPRVTLRGRAVQAALKKGAVVEIAEADQAVSLQATGVLMVAGKKLPLLAAKGNGAAGERTRLSLRIPRAVQRKVRRALRQGKRVRAQVQVSAANTSAGSGLATQTIAIGPAGRKRH